MNSLRRASTRHLVALTLVASSGISLTWSQDAPRSDVDDGRALYNEVGCYQCHGRAGQGGSFGGPAPVLAGTDMTLASYLYVLRNPPSDMPPYAESVLSDEEAADIYAYIRSLPGVRDPREIPILKDAGP